MICNYLLQSTCADVRPVLALLLQTFFFEKISSKFVLFRTDSNVHHSTQFSAGKSFITLPLPARLDINALFGPFAIENILSLDISFFTFQRFHFSSFTCSFSNTCLSSHLHTQRLSHNHFPHSFFFLCSYSSYAHYIFLAYATRSVDARISNTEHY